MENIFFEDIKKQIEVGFNDNGWITVYKSIQRGGQYSAIVDIDKFEDALKGYSWDISIGSCRLYVTEDREYIKNDGFEPIVYYREEFGQYDNYKELSQDFILYHNLYEKYKSPNEKEYMYIDSNGDEEDVAKITENEVIIKLKFLKDYISARNKHFFVYFDYMRYSEKTLSTLNTTEINQNQEKTGCYFYNQIIRDISNDYRMNKQEKTLGWIMGKVLIKNIEDWTYNQLWGNMEIRNQYEDFIIGYDENGNEKIFTCNEDKLGNYFGKNPDAPQYVTPVFFRKEVLQKYYSNAKKYSVEDGLIRCGSKILRLDNNCQDYVIVCLGDLGKDLHYNEQKYWKTFNIAPPQKGSFSHTARTRFFEGNFCDPDKPDLYLKMKLSQFNEKWIKKYNWQLFKPLSEEDNHYLQTLHLLSTSDNSKEFDEQILALTKIFIDSLNEKELSKNILITKDNAKGIDKFEAFLKHNNLGTSKMITFFRNIQNLRSTTVAHRRSEKGIDKKLSEYFKFESNSLDKILEEIILNFICTLNTLENQFLEEYKND